MVNTLKLKSMQPQLPFFPEHTKYINATLGLFSKDDYVYYLHKISEAKMHDKNFLQYLKQARRL